MRSLPLNQLRVKYINGAWYLRVLEALERLEHRAEKVVLEATELRISTAARRAKLQMAEVVEAVLKELGIFKPWKPPPPPFDPP